MNNKFLQKMILSILFTVLFLHNNSSPFDNKGELMSVNESINRLIYSEESTKSIADALKIIPKNYVCSIEQLIERIDENKKTYFEIGLDYYANSERKSKIIYKWIGLKAAYLIECILYKNDTNVLCNRKLEDVTFTDVIICGYIFKKGIIKAIDIPDYELTLSDMEEIKKCYIKWWDTNKTQSLDSLKIKWQKGVRPLNGSNYHWE